MITKPIGLYVHIPFCVRKCNYCDFCSFPMNDVDWRSRYIDALCDEIRSYKGREIAVDSIFFGGGTPSLLSSNEFIQIVEAIRDIFAVLPDTEFTVEANPKTVDEEKLKTFISCGVNRLSIGLQSIHKNEMKILGRVHNFEEFRDSFLLARKLGLENINVDLMYGIPSQTIDSFNKTLDEVLKLSPEHISLYGLIIEENTPFGRNLDKLDLPGDDTECDMYELACKRLSSAGYNHYEISNYAKEGYYCRHNLKYWKDSKYLGFGVAAHSYLFGRRFANPESVDEYLSGERAKYESGEVIDKENEAYEFVMLGLRLCDGFSLSEYKSRFGNDFLRGREEIIVSLVNLGYVKLDDDCISLTERGFYISNYILNELI